MNSAQRIAFILTLILGTACSNVRAEVADPESSEKISKLHQSLIGAWAIAGQPGTTNEPKADAENRILESRSSG